MFLEKINYRILAIRIKKSKFNQMQQIQTWLSEPIPPEISDCEKKSAQSLLVSLIGDMDVNDQLHKLGLFSEGSLGFTIRFFYKFTYITRSYLEIRKDLKQIHSNFCSGEQNLKLGDEQKLSLEKYGMIYDLAQLDKLIKSFDANWLFEENPTLEKLERAAQRAKEINDYFEGEFDKSFTFPAGALAFENTLNRREVYNEIQDFFYALYAWINHNIYKLSHVSHGTTDTNRIAHLYPGFNEDSFTLRQFLSNQIYQLRLDHLISSKNKILLEDNLGSTWLAHLETRYTDTLLEVYECIELQHQHLQVPDGIAEVFRIIRILMALLLGHKNWFINDHDNQNIRDNLFRKGKWENEKKGAGFICSEFIGILLIAIIQELNDKIRNDLKEKGVQLIPEQILESPLSERENLYLLTPNRLLEALKERNAVTKISYDHVLPKIHAGIWVPSIKDTCSQDLFQESKKEQKMPAREFYSNLSQVT